MEKKQSRLKVIKDKRLYIRKKNIKQIKGQITLLELFEKKNKNLISKENEELKNEELENKELENEQLEKNELEKNELKENELKENELEKLKEQIEKQINIEDELEKEFKTNLNLNNNLSNNSLIIIPNTIRIISKPVKYINNKIKVISKPTTKKIINNSFEEIS